MTRDDIIRMAKEAHKDLVTVDYPGHAGQLDPWTLRLLERFAALVAAAEQRPLTDVTEAVTKTVIETEKLLCEKIGRQWQPSGMSIQTLVDELATLVAAAEREAIGNIILDYAGRDDLSDSDESLLKHLFELIRARGET